VFNSSSYPKTNEVEERTVGILNESSSISYLMNHIYIDFGYLKNLNVKEASEKIMQDYIYVTNELKNLSNNS
jgi:hypothetical protein